MKEYVKEILDANNIVLNESILDYYELRELLPEGVQAVDLLVLKRDADFDYEDSSYIDVSTYHMIVNGQYMTHDDVYEEIFEEIKSLDEYSTKYLKI